MVSTVGISFSFFVSLSVFSFFTSLPAARLLLDLLLFPALGLLFFFCEDLSSKSSLRLFFFFKVVIFSFFSRLSGFAGVLERLKNFQLCQGKIKSLKFRDVAFPLFCMFLYAIFSFKNSIVLRDKCIFFYSKIIDW